MTQCMGPGRMTQYIAPNTLTWLTIRKAWGCFSNPFLGFWTVNSEQQENKRQLNIAFLKTFKDTVSKIGLEVQISSVITAG